MRDTAENEELRLQTDKVQLVIIFLREQNALSSMNINWYQLMQTIRQNKTKLCSVELKLNRRLN